MMQNEETTGIALIKFGQQKHIQSLYKDGLLYMNTIEYFSKLESVQGDPYEGLTYWLQQEKIEIKIGNYKLEGLAAPVRIISPQEDPYTHIYCLVSIYGGLPIRDDSKIVDERITKFGDTLCLMPVGDFMKKLDLALKSNKSIIRYKYGLVNYIDKNTYHGKVGVFKKFDDHKYMQEFRVAIQTMEQSTPFELEIGAIENAHTMEISKFKNIVRIDGGKQYLEF